MCRAERPIVWISEVSLRRKPSLSASRMQTIETSGRSSPSRSRFTPTRASNAPSRSSRRIVIALDRVELGVQPLAPQPLLLQVAREVLGQPLGEGGDEDALALRGPLLDLLQQRRHLAPRRLDADDRVDQAGGADHLLDDLAAGHRDLVVGRRGRDEHPPLNSDSSREMLKSPALGYTPIGLVDDDPRKKNLRLHGVRVLGTTERPVAAAARVEARRGADRDPVCGRRRAPADRERRLRRGHPGQDAPGHLRAHLGGPRPRRADPSRPGGGRARPRAGRGRPRGRLDVRRGRNRARYRRRRVDRLRALPPDRAPRRRAPRPHRPRGARAVRDRARARGRAELPRRDPDHRRRQERGEDAPGLRALPAQDRLPRGGVQARPSDGGEPDRVGAQQRPRDEGDRAGRGRVRGGAFRARLDRQGAQPAGRVRPVQDAVRVDRGGLRPPSRRRRRASSPSGSATSSAPRAA